MLDIKYIKEKPEEVIARLAKKGKDAREDIEKILAQGKHVLTTMDIGGAMSLKTYFKNVVTIYIKRNKKLLMSAILRKNSSIDDKVNRLMGIESENKNAEICDYIVEFDTYDQAVEQLCDILNVCNKG